MSPVHFINAKETLMSESRSVITWVMLVSASVMAQEGTPVATPTPEEIKRVLDYQDNGKDQGPVLIELVPCLKVDTTKGSPTIYNCIERVSGPVKKGTSVSGWMAWFVPKGGAYEDVAVQFLHEGQVRQTVDLKVEGFSRTRTYRSHSFGKPGKWSIKVLRGDKEVGSADVTVE